MANVNPLYPCTQYELYATADLLYSNLANDLDDFKAKNTKYKDTFVAAVRDRRKTAMDLPDEESRDEDHKTLLGKLKNEYLPPMLDNFNDLKGYIKNGWPDEDPNPRYDSAGQNEYDRASKFNWEVAAGLAKKTDKFVTDNNEILTTPGGMPETFPEKVATDKTNFDESYAKFKVARETGNATGEKIKANNIVYKDMQDILEDGYERVYRRNDTKKHEYTFKALKDIVSPPGGASLKVTVKREDDTLVAGADVTIKMAGEPAITVKTGPDGVAPFVHIDAADYAGSVVFNGVTTSFKKTVNVGVDARITIVVSAS